VACPHRNYALNTVQSFVQRLRSISRSEANHSSWYKARGSLLLHGLELVPHLPGGAAALVLLALQSFHPVLVVELALLLINQHLHFEQMSLMHLLFEMIRSVCLLQWMAMWRADVRTLLAGHFRAICYAQNEVWKKDDGTGAQQLIHHLELFYSRLSQSRASRSAARL
jgi:hypothetical protein